MRLLAVPIITVLIHPAQFHLKRGLSPSISKLVVMGRLLARTGLDFVAHGHLITQACDYHLINISDRISEEPDIKAFLSEKSKPILALRNTVVGVALSRFDNRFARYPWDSPIGDLVCDALAEEGTKYG